MKTADEYTVKVQLEKSRGPQGPEGKDGFSPKIEIEEIEGGHRVYVTDANGTQAFDVMNGDAGGVTKETDPTVPAWAKQPSKPTYTASEVGALPATTQIPSVPETLPNPHPIVINGVSYDGSEKKEITVQAEAGAGIDDTTPSTEKTYSSKHIDDLLNAQKEANEAQDEAIAKRAKDADLSAVAKSGSYNDLSNKPTIPTVPSALPNPKKLKLTGAVTAEYDGSSEVSVEIPAGGGGTGGGETAWTYAETILAEGVISSGTAANTNTDTGLTQATLKEWEIFGASVKGVGVGVAVMVHANNNNQWNLLDSIGSDMRVLFRWLDSSKKVLEPVFVTQKNIMNSNGSFSSFARRGRITESLFIDGKSPCCLRRAEGGFGALADTTAIKIINGAELTSDLKWQIIGIKEAT